MDKGFHEAIEETNYQQFVEQSENISVPIIGDKKTCDIDSKIENDKNVICQRKFIIGPAKLLLSKDEHIAKRHNVNFLEQILGNGKHVASQYLSGSKVVDQYNKMEYVPENDIVVEYANPDYTNLKKSLSETSNARILYMCYRRKRYLNKNNPVSLEHIRATIKFRGIKCTLKELTSNNIFYHYGNLAFKIMIYTEIIEKFRQWQINAYCPTFMIRNYCKSFIDEYYNKVFDDISIEIKSLYNRYRIIIDEYLIKFKNNDNKKEHKYNEYLNSLFNKLHEIIKEIIIHFDVHPIHEMLKFSESVFLDIYIQNSEFYYYLRNKNIDLQLQNLRLFTVGDIQIIGNGFHECNSLDQICYQRIFQKNFPNKCCPKYLLSIESSYLKYRRKSPIPSNILHAAVQYYNYNLHMKSVSTLLLKNSIVVTTEPYLSQNVRWDKCFSTCDNTGFVMRRCMPTIYHRKIELINTYFKMNGAVLMNLPRNINTNILMNNKFFNNSEYFDIIIKTIDKIYVYDCKKKKLESMLLKDYEKEKSVKSIESISLFGCMNPIYGVLSSTVAYAQGSTHSNAVLCDLNKIDESDQLVALTRVNNIHNLKVCNVRTGYNLNQMNIIEKSVRKEKKRKRFNKRLRWFYCRE